MAVVYRSTAYMNTMTAAAGLSLCHISCCGMSPLCICMYVCMYVCMHACMYLCMQKTRCMPTCCLCIATMQKPHSTLAASAYLYWQARARPPHTDKLPLRIIDDDSLKVSSKDGGSSGLGAICRRPFSRDISCPGLTTHPCNHQLSLLST